MGSMIGSVLGSVAGNFIAPGIGGQIGGALGGAIGGGIGGGGGSPETRQVVASLPSWLTNPYKSQVTQAGTLAGLPYNPATNSQVAGFNPQQSQAFDLTNNLVGQYQPYFNTALGNTQNLGQQAMGGLSNPQFQSYMNPYIQNVLDTSRQQQFQNYGIAQNQLSEQAAGAGAFGNSRLGLAQGQLGSNFLMNLGAQQANTLAGGFNTALQGYQTGINQGLGAANQLGSLATNQQNTGIAGINALYGAGASQQQLQQSQYNSATQNALQQQQFPWSQLQNYQNVMQAPASQYGIKTGTLTPYAAPGWQQGLGLGSMLGGMGGTGSLGSGLSSLYQGSNLQNGMNSFFAGNGFSNGWGLNSAINSSITNPANASFFNEGGVVGYAKGGPVKTRQISPEDAAGAPMYFHQRDRAMPRMPKGYAMGGVAVVDEPYPKDDFSNLQTRLDNYLSTVDDANRILKSGTYDKGMVLDNGKIAKGGEPLSNGLRDEIKQQRDYYQSILQNPYKDFNTDQFQQQRDGWQGGDLNYSDAMRNGWIAGQRQPEMPNAQAGQGLKKGGKVDPSTLTQGMRSGGLLHKAPKGKAAKLPKAQGLAMLQALSQLSQQPGAGQMPQVGAPMGPTGPQPQMGMLVGGQIPHSLGGYARGGIVGDNQGHSVPLKKEYGIAGCYADGGEVASIPQPGTLTGNTYSLGSLLNEARAQNYVNQLLGTNPQTLPEGYRKGGIVGFETGGGILDNLENYAGLGAGAIGKFLGVSNPFSTYDPNATSAYQMPPPNPASNTPIQNLMSGNGPVSHLENKLNPLNLVASGWQYLNTPGDANPDGTPKLPAGTKTHGITDADHALMEAIQAIGRDHSEPVNQQPQQMVNEQPQEQQGGFQNPVGPFGGQMNLPMLAFGSGLLAKGGGLQYQAMGEGGKDMLAQIMAQRGQDAQYAWRNGMLGINQQRQNTNQQNSNYRGMDLGPKIALQQAQAAAEWAKAQGGTLEQRAQNWAKALGQFEPSLLTMSPEQQQELFMRFAANSGGQQQNILAPSQQQMGQLPPGFVLRGQ